MAERTDLMSNPQYRNWLKGSLSFMHMKEGLEEFVNNQSVRFHYQLRASLRQPISRLSSVTDRCMKINCNTVNIYKDRFTKEWKINCDSKICDAWLEELLKYYSSDSLTDIGPRIVNSRNWASEHWEVMKVFMPSGQYATTSARDTDVAAILAILKNCSFFSKFVGRLDLIVEILCFRNSLINSPDLQTQDSVLREGLNKMVQFLRSLTSLTGTETTAVKQAINRIEELQEDKVVLWHRSDLEATALRLKKDAFIIDLSHVVDRTGASVIPHMANWLTKPDWNESSPGPFASYEDQLRHLQMYLVKLYQKNLTWTSPVCCEEELTLGSMYVKPELKLVRFRDERLGTLEVRKDMHISKRAVLKSYNDVFYLDSKQCRQIYIAGDAGVGKTVYCQKMVSTWCNAVLNIDDEGDSEDDLLMMGKFNLLFYIRLRDCVAEYDVSDMVSNQLLYYSKLSQSLNVSKLIDKEKCLLILDGLDEWTCPPVQKFPFINPGIPGRHFMNKTLVTLTTLRNWRLEELKLKTTEYEMHIELFGLATESVNPFTKRIVDLLNKKSGIIKDISDFNAEIRQQKLESLQTLPVVLMQLIVVWFFQGDLGKSQVQLYSTLTEVILSHAKKHLTAPTSMKASAIPAETALPDCLDKRECCHTQKQLVYGLAKVAFLGMFKRHDTEALVFQSSATRVYDMAAEDYAAFLNSGFLSQRRVLGICSARLKRLSFLHKNLQDFLAAVFVGWCNLDEFQTEFEKICSDLDTVLDKSQMFKFLAGICPEKTRYLLQNFTEVVSADIRVQSYRETSTYEFPSLIERIQICVVDCVVEGVKNGCSYHDICLLLEDFVITSTSFSDCVKHLLSHNVSHIKSMYYSTLDISGHDDRQMLKALLSQMQNAEHLCKLSLDDPAALVNTELLEKILSTARQSLKVLQLNNLSLETLTKPISYVFSSMKSLTSLSLCQVELTHQQINCLLVFLSEQHNLTDLRLFCFDCTDHIEGQCRPMLDLSGMTSMKRLSLSYLSVDNLSVLSDNLLLVYLETVTMSEMTCMTFLERISDIKQKIEVVMAWVTVTPDGNARVDLRNILGQNDRLIVTGLKLNDWNNTWTVSFHT